MANAASKTNLTLRIFIGMVAGILSGLLLKALFDDSGDYAFSVFGTSISTYTIFVDGIFHVIGTIFVASLKMLVVPLIFVSLVCGVSNLTDPAKLGRLGGKAVGLYLATTGIAVVTALFMANLLQPGVGVEMATDQTFKPKEAPGLAQVIIDMFPSNPVNAMAEGNMLQIIVFSLLFGIAIALSGEPGKRVASFFNDLNSVIMKLVMILMNLAPYGVFALMAKLMVTVDPKAIINLSQYFVLVAALLVFHGLFTYSVILKLFSGLSPLVFLRKMRDVWLFAFTTSSSNATIPVTLETVTKKLGVKNNVASFTVPLGATINMDGTAIMQGVATAFIAQLFGVDLSLADLLMVVLTATLASVGAAGVPGVGLITLAMVLQQVNLPVEGIAIIIGVDRLLDMTRTMVNVTGDSMVTCVIAKSEGEIDETVFNDPDAGGKDEELHMETLNKS